MRGIDAQRLANCAFVLILEVRLDQNLAVARHRQLVEQLAHEALHLLSGDVVERPGGIVGGGVHGVGIR